MEKQIESLVAGLGWEIVTSCLLVAGGFLISYLLHRRPFRAMRRDLEAMRAQLAQRETAGTKPLPGSGNEADTPDTTVDYIGACAIVDAYISPATRDMRDSTRLVVRHDFMNRFDKVTGAKLGEYEYNRPLLHQWMQSNAARFLVENRANMH